MRYYIADLHFCHSNLNQRMDRRGFEDANAMNEYMIRQWNSRVRKYLIVGNHDRYLDNNSFA